MASTKFRGTCEGDSHLALVHVGLGIVCRGHHGAGDRAEGGSTIVGRHAVRWGPGRLCGVYGADAVGMLGSLVGRLGLLCLLVWLLLL